MCLNNNERKAPPGDETERSKLGGDFSCLKIEIMEMIENIIEEHFVRPLMKIFSGEEAPVGWNLRKTAEDWNCCFHDPYWKKNFHQAMTPIYRRLLSGN